MKSRCTQGKISYRDWYENRFFISASSVCRKARCLHFKYVNDGNAAEQWKPFKRALDKLFCECKKPLKSIKARHENIYRENSISAFRFPSSTSYKGKQYVKLVAGNKKRKNILCKYLPSGHVIKIHQTHNSIPITQHYTCRLAL